MHPSITTHINPSEQLRDKLCMKYDIHTVKLQEYMCSTKSGKYLSKKEPNSNTIQAFEFFLHVKSASNRFNNRKQGPEIETGLRVFNNSKKKATET